MHHQAGANCTDANFYFLTIFQFVVVQNQMGPGPTQPLPICFWIFGFVLTLQSPLVGRFTTVSRTGFSGGSVIHNFNNFHCIFFVQLCCHAKCLDHTLYFFPHFPDMRVLD